MINDKTKKHQTLKVLALGLIPASLTGAIASVSMINFASAEQASSVSLYSESVTISNPSFATASNYSASNSFTGWSAIETNSMARGVIIDTSTDASYTGRFSQYQDNYNLINNPYAHSSDDTRVLMINSQSSSKEPQYTSKGYRSNSITLNANSYYKFSVAVKTALNGEESASASVYVSGLKDLDGEDISLKYENLTNREWKECFFFIATGNSSQTITLDLYLGSASGDRSYGAVFFDDIQGYRYSENEFFDECTREGFLGVDNYTQIMSSHETPIYLINTLQESKPLIENLDSYNFDFENPIAPDSNTLGDEFSIISKSSGHALIQDMVTMQGSDFKNLTGYGYVGTDLSKDNEQAMILFTGEKDNNGNMVNASGYVGVASKSIDILAHNIYKVSLKVKVSNITSGSFYLKVQENDDIITSLYPELLTDDENDKTKTLYSPLSGQTSGITSNSTNSWTNDYQTVEFYIKGHSLFNSSVNLELWLGDEQTPAMGCVVVDNIVVEYATQSDYTNASNKLQLSVALPSQSITNGDFDLSGIESTTDLYPVTAESWTSEKELDTLDSGIVYLYDLEHYLTTYANKYDWAGIYPGKATLSAKEVPNNVYMMNNSTKSYQSITSSTFSLSANNYYRLNFDYYTQNAIEGTSQIKVEIIDENGIVLFSKSNISSLNAWSNMEINIRTAQNVGHTAYVKISLGEEDNEVSGLVYLDKFTLTADSTIADTFASKAVKSDLSLLYLNSSENGAITNDVSSSNAYELSVGEIYNSSYAGADVSECARGGIISGKENPFVEYNESLSIEDSNYLVLTSKVASEVMLKSKYNFTLSGSDSTASYYKLSFDLATIFNVQAENASTDKHECKYGVSILIDGYEEITGLLSKEELKHFDIIYMSTSSSTPALTIKLVSDCDDTVGTALITRLNFAASTEAEYKQALRSSEYEKSIFTSKISNSTSVDTDTDTDTTEETTPTSESNAWIAIPSIITGLAVIIGVVAMAFKHVKLKKIEKIKKETYDRKLAINHDAILDEAQKRRDVELDALNNAKASLIADKENLEVAHKEFIKENRNKEGGKISRDVEKAFKTFNANINRINEKLNILNEKIDYTISAEYLLVLERRIVMEEEDKFKAEKKATKLASKQDKQNKQDKQ